MGSKKSGSGPGAGRRRPANARFAAPRMPTPAETWQAIRTRLTPASHPSTTSESAMDSSYNPTDLFVGESEPRDKSSRRTVELLNPNAATASRFKPRPHPRKAKSSAANSTSRYGDDDEAGPSSGITHDPVSHIVVDNDFEQFTPKVAQSDSGSTNRTPGASGKVTGTGHGSDEEDGPYTPSDAASISRGQRGWARKNPVYEMLVDRIWPNVGHFLDSSFPEPAKERSFQKETWFMNKQGALMSGLYFLIAWILTCALLPMPLNMFSWMAYVLIGGIFTSPILFMIIFDLPRRAPWIYQPWLAGATWVFADVLVIEMKYCGYYAANNQCGTRSFIFLFGWALGQPVLAVFAMKQARPWAIAGAIQWLVLVCSLLMTEENYPTLFYRNIVTFSLFQTFIIMTSFMKERSDRQMFALRQQLKIQYRATQSAQVMERRAGDSKKRFVSYIFHEVRVPLNTALLAVQNLEGENVFKGLEEDQKEMVHGLMGSLTMMEKVLNDVLSFNRMESGKFAQARRAFEFHKSIQLVALSHRSQAQMAGIALEVDLDSAIDKIGGVFLGDEMRLRQVTSNLVSNSIKFTETGSVKIVTKLLYPRVEPTPSMEIDDPLQLARVNAERQAHITPLDDRDAIVPVLNEKTGSTMVEDRIDDKEKGYMATGPSTANASGTWGGDVEKGVHLPTLNADNIGRRQSRDSGREQKEREERNRYKAIVRVEIHDTGVGLRKQDVVDNRLFSPYVQTEIGRRQGGKGSGLGLALVRQIVKLSHGRLGVESTFGKGTCIWFELPYSLPRNKGASTPPGPVHPDDPESGVRDSQLHVQPPYPPYPHFPPQLPRWYSHRQPPPEGQDSDRGPSPDEQNDPDVSRDTALTGSTAADSMGEEVPRERPSVMTTDSTRPLLQSSMSTINTGMQMHQHQQPGGGLGVPMDSRGGVELDGIQAAVFPAVRGMSDASNVTTASTDSAGPSIRGSTTSGALSPEVVVTEQRDPFAVASPPLAPTLNAVPSYPGIAQATSKRRSSEWRRDLAQPSSLSRVDDIDAERGERVPSPVSPKTPRSPDVPTQAQTQAQAQAQVRVGADVNEDERPLCTLVVDDDKLTRMLMSRMLTRLGHQVTTAENGKMALDLLMDSFAGAESAPTYDIVFLDNQMPLMSGVEVASHVREAGEHIFIVGCTGNALREDQDEYMAAGADGIIPKPIHQKAVLDMIKLARRRIKGETCWTPPDERRE